MTATAAKLAENPIVWADIDVVMLDMDGTLLDLHFDNDFWQRLVIERWAQRQGISVDEANQALNARFSASRGTLAWYSTRYWAEQLDLDIVALKREIAHKIQLRPATERFLQAVQASGKQLWLLTNAHPESLQLKMEKTGLASYFQVILSSHELGYCKEQPEFWRELAALHPYDAARCLFVDDTETVLAAAQQAGIGQVLAILAPDSCQPAKPRGAYPAVHDFDEVLPVA